MQGSKIRNSFGTKLRKYKRLIGLAAGVLIAVIVWNLPLHGLEAEGQKCLAITLFAVTFWATGVIHTGYTALLMLLGYVLMNVAPAEAVFSLWHSPLMLLIVGSYLMAAAVQESGLGKRIAYSFILKYVNSFTSVIVSAYILGFLLSFFIPHPWPRSFLIMSVMTVIIKSAGLPKKEAAIVGLAVFGGSVPNTTMILTADSSLNVVAASMGEASLSWLGWVKYMGVPGLVASVLTCLLQLKLFKPEVAFKLDREVVEKERRALGPLSGGEKKTLLWIVLAIIFWALDSIHQLHPGWIAALVAVGLSLPAVGDVLKPNSWTHVALGTLFFLTAAIAIGKVGSITGMNEWVAATVLPSQVPANPFVFAALVTTVSIAVHMLLGSVMSVLVILAPAFIVYATGMGWDPLFPILLVYTSVAMHWILPFHHMNILVGMGEAEYSDAEVMRLGVPLTFVIYIVTLLVEVPWWKLMGLI